MDVKELYEQFKQFMNDTQVAIIQNQLEVSCYLTGKEKEIQVKEIIKNLEKFCKIIFPEFE